MAILVSTDEKLITELYWSHIAKHFAEIVDHSIYILISIYETEPFAISDFSNDIECVELQPFREITDGILRRKQDVGLVEEFLGCAVHIRFILYQGAHRKSMVHGFPQVCMVLLISCGE